LGRFAWGRKAEALAMSDGMADYEAAIAPRKAALFAKLAGDVAEVWLPVERQDGADVVEGARANVGVVLEELGGGFHPRAHVGAAVPPHVRPNDGGCWGVLVRR
jgi:hypothetical protein